MIIKSSTGKNNIFDCHQDGAADGTLLFSACVSVCLLCFFYSRYFWTVLSRYPLTPVTDLRFCFPPVISFLLIANY